MKKWIFTTLFLVMFTIFLGKGKNSDIMQSSNLMVTSGELKHLDLYSPEMNETIKVDVWTPEGY